MFRVGEVYRFDYTGCPTLGRVQEVVKTKGSFRVLIQYDNPVGRVGGPFRTLDDWHQPTLEMMMDTSHPSAWVFGPLDFQICL